MKSAPNVLRRFMNGAGALCVLMATTRDAHAYVDPGTGAMILQIIAAVAAGAMFYFRELRDKIASWYSRLTSRSATKKDEKK